MSVYEGKIAENGSLLHGRVGAQFVRCEFRNFSFEEYVFEGTLFVECSFTDCNFSGNKLIESVFNRCKLISCLFIGAEFTNCDFLTSYLDDVSFSGALITGCVFTSCEIERPFLLGTQVEHSYGLQVSCVNDSKGKQLLYYPEEDRVFHALFCGNSDDCARQANSFEGVFGFAGYAKGELSGLIKSLKENFVSGEERMYAAL